MATQTHLAASEHARTERRSGMVIRLTENEREFVERALSEQPASEEDMLLGEQETFTKTAKFGNGYEMDIKVCGVEFEDGEDNRPYTEAVLFKDGCEAACSEPEDDFFGEWTLEHNGKEFTAEVV